MDVLDSAQAKLRSHDGTPVPALGGDDHESRLCPDPTKEPETTDSANSIKYQEYVSGLKYPWAIRVGTVMFDGCDESTGTLLEAKAGIDFLFDGNDRLQWWVYREKNPAIQMNRQAEVAAAVGRNVVWHAQTEKGFRGLSKIKGELPWANLSVVYDPN